jgi:hypothetical protein
MQSCKTVMALTLIDESDLCMEVAVALQREVTPF